MKKILTGKIEDSTKSLLQNCIETVTDLYKFPVWPRGGKKLAEKTEKMYPLKILQVRFASQLDDLKASLMLHDSETEK